METLADIFAALRLARALKSLWHAHDDLCAVDSGVSCAVAAMDAMGQLRAIETAWGVDLNPHIVWRVMAEMVEGRRW